MRSVKIVLSKIVLLLVLVSGCAEKPTTAAPLVPEPDPVTWENAETKVLIIGNSLTYSNN